MTNENEVKLKRLKEHDAHIVYSLEELASFIRKDRISAAAAMFDEDIQKYGHTLISRHASTTGEPVWYFEGNKRQDEDYVISRSRFKNHKPSYDLR